MRAWIAAAVTVMMASQVQVAWGYCLQRFGNVEGYSTWKQEVPYYLSDNIKDPSHVAAIDAAFNTWGSVPCSTLSFRKAGTFELSSVPFKGHPYGIYVYWHEAEASYPTDPKYVTYAFLSVEADLDGQGDITGGSIAVNGFSAEWATDGNMNAFDLQGEMTERLGQVIGLEPSNAAETVMRRYFKLGDTEKRTLKTDDENAVAYLYGDGTCTSQPPTPDATSGCAEPPPPSGTGVDPGTEPTTDPTPPGDPTSPGPMDLNHGPGQPCTTGTQCNPGEVCSFEGVCVASGAGANNGTSSGCSVAGAVADSSQLQLMLLLAGLLIGRARRRRR